MLYFIYLHFVLSRVYISVVVGFVCHIWLCKQNDIISYAFYNEVLTDYIYAKLIYANHLLNAKLIL